MKQQTAVELLKQDIDLEIKLGTKMVVNWDMYLEMEKQQIIDAFGVGCHHESKRLVGYQDIAEQYYNETYGSKGSDAANGNNIEKVPNVTTTMKGQLYLKSQPNRWFVVYDIDGFTKGEFPIHPKYEKYYFLDEEDEGKEVEFEVWNGYAKLIVREMLDEIKKLESTSSQTEISDEEIKKSAYDYASVYIYTDSIIDKHDITLSWIRAIQWYREQLKKK